MKIDDKDKEIIACLVSGLTIKEVAPKVFLSVRAVEERVRKIKEITGSVTKAQMIHRLYVGGFFA